MQVVDADHDFELVGEVDVPQACSNKTASPEEEKSIKGLFESFEEPGFLESVAALIVLSTLPASIAYSTFVALIAGFYYQEANLAGSLGEDILKRVLQRNQSVLHSYQKILDWVHKHLPSTVQSYKVYFLDTFKGALQPTEKGLIEIRQSVPPKLIWILSIICILATQLLLPLIFPILLQRSYVRIRISIPMRILALTPVWLAIVFLVWDKLHQSRLGKKSPALKRG